MVDETLGITGVGDAQTKKEALKIACISAEYQLHALNLVGLLFSYVVLFLILVIA